MTEFLQTSQIEKVDVDNLKIAVQSLSKAELGDFLEWLDCYQEMVWDRQIEEDMKIGKLNHLIEEAKKEFREGKCRQI